MRRTTLLLLAAAQACGGSSATTSTVTPPAPNGDAPAVADPSYVIHEWGLIDVDVGGAVEVAAGPGIPAAAPAAVRKPVLYVGLDEGVDAQRFSVRVRIPSGSIVEHWPAGEGGGDTLARPSVGARRCGGAARDVTLDTRMIALACDTPDGYCEVYDLPGYVAEGSACLRVGGEDATLLFYRGALGGVSLPYRVSRSPGGDVIVEATRDLPAPIGELWRVSHVPTGTAVTRASPPRSGQRVALGAPAPADVAESRARLAADLAALGLTPAEAEAFLRAWTRELFSVSSGELARRSAPVREELLYWLPVEDADRIAPLELAPPPRELRRAILVRVAL